MSEEYHQVTSKLGGYDFYRQILGSPRYVVGPMVDQSELPWRILSRRYGAQLVYTPMINAKVFMDPKNPKYQDLSFDVPNGEEGGPSDRPLIAQFCANDPDLLLAAAKVVEPYCDAIDINFGCPQDIARRGKYGCFLQDDWDLVYRLINILHTNLNIPVTAKFRVFPTIEKTVAYAQMMERAGAQILSCHGRLREQRGVISGLADWDKIRAVKQAVKVPVFANGNVLYASDAIRCLAHTGADALMSAEGQLYNPALFASLPKLITDDVIASAIPPSPTNPTNFPAYALHLLSHPPHADLALEYLSIVRSIKTPSALSAVKGHLFKIMRPALGVEKDLRERLGQVRGNSEALQEYQAICEEMRIRMEKAAKPFEGVPLTKLAKLDESSGSVLLPYWLAQPYFRPPPPTPRDRGKDRVKFIADNPPQAIPDVDIASAIKRPLSGAVYPQEDLMKRAKQ